MDFNKKLPKMGQSFHASLNKAGAPSLEKALKSAHDPNFGKDKIKAIVNAIKPAEGAIQYKGGMSRDQVKKALSQMGKYKKVAKKIFANYTKHYGDQTPKKVIPFRPYLDETPSPHHGVTSVAQLNKTESSISHVVDNRQVGTESGQGHVVSIFHRNTPPSPPTSSIGPVNPIDRDWREAA